MSNMFCFAADCALREENWTDPEIPGEQCAIWPTNPRDWYDIRTELPYMAEIVLDQCTTSICRKLIDYTRQHLEMTEEIELWRLWMGAENYKIHWYAISIDALTPEDLLTLYTMQDIFGRDFPRRNRAAHTSSYAIQHCLTITRTPSEWNSPRMKNWRDLYPAP